MSIIFFAQSLDCLSYVVSREGWLEDNSINPLRKTSKYVSEAIEANSGTVDVNAKPITDFLQALVSMLVSVSFSCSFLLFIRICLSLSGCLKAICVCYQISEKA